jgi:hypothetical protein
MTESIQQGKVDRIFTRMTAFSKRLILAFLFLLHPSPLSYIPKQPPEHFPVICSKRHINDKALIFQRRVNLSHLLRVHVDQVDEFLVEVRVSLVLEFGVLVR